MINRRMFGGTILGGLLTAIFWPLGALKAKVKKAKDGFVRTCPTWSYWKEPIDVYRWENEDRFTGLERKSRIYVEDEFSPRMGVSSQTLGHIDVDCAHIRSLRVVKQIWVDVDGNERIDFLLKLRYKPEVSSIDEMLPSEYISALRRSSKDGCTNFEELERRVSAPK